MPSRSRKRYFEKKKLSQKKQEEEETTGSLSKEKTRRPGSKTAGIIYFILALVTSIMFTLANQFIVGILVTSVLIFFSIKNFRDSPIQQNS